MLPLADAVVPLDEAARAVDLAHDALDEALGRGEAGLDDAVHRYFPLHA